MSDEPVFTATGRPLRSTRAPQRAIESHASTTSKRKREDEPLSDPTEQLEFLLKNPKSILTRIDISVSF
jgi:hypothetical protein